MNLWALGGRQKPTRRPLSIPSLSVSDLYFKNISRDQSSGGEKRAKGTWGDVGIPLTKGHLFSTFILKVPPNLWNL